jgi:hypothetical protein
MQARIVVAIVIMLLPAGVGAQRLPRGRTAGGRRPGEPVPLSPQPAPIARELAYRRMRVSVESYPLISYVQTPSLAGDGRTAAWTMFGGGTRAAYRLTRHASATFDLTSSFAGSPMLVQTAEVGTRFGPERSEGRAQPFVDVRVGYISAYDQSLGSLSLDPFGVPTTRGVYGARYSNGFGGVVGIGMEYDLTRTFSLTTAGSVMRSRMTAHDLASTPAIAPGFAMTAFRYTIGLKYTPVRLVTPLASERP